MFERFTYPARRVVVLAQEEARRLGHPHLGTPHLLLALLDEDAGPLAELGLTRDAIETQLRQVLASDEAAGVDDAEILRTIGIDVDAIRAALEANFGPGAFDRVLDGPAPAPARSRLGRLRRLRGDGPRDERSLLLRRRARAGAHLPFSPAAKKTLELSLREALRLQDRSIGTDHLLLGLLRCDQGLGTAVLDGLGVDRDALRARIEQRRRRSA